MYNSVLAALAFAAVAPALALAEDAKAPPPPYTLTANVSLVSDYYFRGLTQTWNQPAIQGGFDFAHSSGLYAGTWASNVSGNEFPGGSLEWDLYGGYNYKVNDDVTVGAGLYFYWYPGANFRKAAAGGPDEKFDTLEAYLNASWKFLSFKWSYALTDYFGIRKATGYAHDTDGTMYFDLSANYGLPVWEGLSLVGHVGYTLFPDDIYNPPGFNGKTDASYWDWKIGVSKTWDGGWNAGLFYVGASNDVWKNVPSFANNSKKDLNSDRLIVQVGRVF
ncbi:MAG TPA: TorF family putative porin [Burkholderiales bacterium]|nr:TorF family putative porin [Burkholderiales bacterium]